MTGSGRNNTAVARDRRKAQNRRRERENFQRRRLVSGEEPYPAHAGYHGRYEIMLRRLR